ncbi:SH3 domain-containing protein [Aeromonas hydrophila]|uniref:SH3 domain-containing protein n=1 Tax=Aeromonas hydrophila TaxID=644 RepID=UPI0033068CA5
MTRGVTHQNLSEDAMMLALITTAHHTCYPNPIAFRAGERVRIGLEDDEFPGWVRTFTADGNEGWAPLSLLTSISAEEALARQDYTARELDVAAGERVRVERELAGWLWVHNDQGQSGWIPASAIAPVS